MDPIASTCKVLIEYAADAVIGFQDHLATRREELRPDDDEQPRDVLPQRKRKTPAVGSPRVGATIPASASGLLAQPVTPVANTRQPTTDTSAQERETTLAGVIIIGLDQHGKDYDNRPPGRTTDQFGAFKCYCNLPAAHKKVTTPSKTSYGQHFWGCPLWTSGPMGKKYITHCNFHQADNIQVVPLDHPSIIRANDAASRARIKRAEADAIVNLNKSTHD